jgi:hypothetical protein
MLTKTKIAPPLSPTIMGKRQMFPNPIADPDAAKIKTILDPHRPLLSSSLLSIFISHTFSLKIFSIKGALLEKELDLPSL